VTSVIQEDPNIASNTEPAARYGGLTELPHHHTRVCEGYPEVGETITVDLVYQPMKDSRDEITFGIIEK